MTMRAQLQVFAWIYALFLVVASAQTAIGALHGQHGGVPVAALAGVEILAALLFLVPATRVAATATLLAIFAVAAVLSALSGDLPARFAYYAATAFIIVSFNGRLKQMEVPIA
jgi:hypothetical protein